jgi:hypothetical protein
LAKQHDETENLKLYLFAPGLDVAKAARELHSEWQDAVYDIAKGYAQYDRDELPKKLQKATEDQIADWVCDDLNHVSGWLGDHIADYVGRHTKMRYDDENYDTVYNAILRACAAEFRMPKLYNALKHE